MTELTESDVTDHWIHTYAGQRVSLSDPKPGQIYFIDIAHALSNLCRFTGHTRRFYSVAEHSVWVSRKLRDAGKGARTVLAGLLHDAHEAYVGDVSSPLRREMTGDYRLIAHRFERVIREKWPQIQGADWSAVRDADLRMLMTEAPQLLPWPPPDDWGVDAEPYHGTSLRCWSPEAARARLEATYVDLMEKVLNG